MLIIYFRFDPDFLNYDEVERQRVNKTNVITTVDDLMFDDRDDDQISLEDKAGGKPATKSVNRLDQLTSNLVGKTKKVFNKD